MACSNLRQLSDAVHGRTLPSELWYGQGLQQPAGFTLVREVLLS